MPRKNNICIFEKADSTSVRNGGTDLSGLSEAELYQCQNLVSDEEKRKIGEEARKWLKENSDLVKKYEEKYKL